MGLNLGDGRDNFFHNKLSIQYSTYVTYGLSNSIESCVRFFKCLIICAMCQSHSHQ